MSGVSGVLNYWLILKGVNYVGLSWVVTKVCEGLDITIPEGFTELI